MTRACTPAKGNGRAKGAAGGDADSGGDGRHDADAAVVVKAMVGGGIMRIRLTAYVQGGSGMCAGLAIACHVWCGHAASK